MTDAYRQFLEKKVPQAKMTGIEPQAMPSFMKGHQSHSTDFLLRCGSGGLFLDTGLGKSLCELEWSRQSAEASNGRALIMTPLAVAHQMRREGEKFGYPVRVIRDQSEFGEGINICNYDRVDRIDPDAFGAIALDESSIIKNFSGKTTRKLIDSFSHHRFRLSATATPAPNDHMELGQHAEFCGVMKSIEMLSMFFINDTSTASQQWRLKKHGVDAFWNWMASWCRMATMPSDLGFADDGYQLPPLNISTTRVHNSVPVDGADLLGGYQISATDMHRVKKLTAESRAKAACEWAMSDSNIWVIWVDTDYEADAIHSVLKGVNGVAEVRGSHPVERKEFALEAFADGSIRILITKPSVCGFGLNWQHCFNTVFVGRSFSYEAWYQAIRRFWRFGQTNPVNCKLVMAEGEDQISRVIDRKAGDHSSMKFSMAKAMKRAHKNASRMVAYDPKHKAELPQWLNA